MDHAFKKFAIEWGNSEVNSKVQYKIHDKICVRTQEEEKLTHHWKLKLKFHNGNAVWDTYVEGCTPAL